MQILLRRAISLLFTGCSLVVLVACSGSQVQHGAAPTPTADPGQQLLTQSAQLFNSAQTLHGIFDSQISGQQITGELKSEIWRLASNKSRTEVQKSTLSQFVTGILEVNDGKQLWQYNPQTRIVYQASAPTPPDPSGTPVQGTPTPGVGQTSDPQQLIFGVLQSIFNNSIGTLVSTNETVNIIHVSPQSRSGSSGSPTGSFDYDGTISLSKQTRLPVALKLTIQGFGQVNITITNLVLNQPLAASLFVFVPPVGTTVEPFPANNNDGDGNTLTLAQAEQQAGYHLLSIPATQKAYQLQSIDALGAPGSQIYTFTYLSGNQTFTLAQGKALANLPSHGQSVSLRGTTGQLISASDGTMTLTWTEQGIGIQINGALDRAHIVSIAGLLS